MKNEVAYLENEKEKLKFELNNFVEKESLVLKNPDGSYTNNVRACFQDLVLEKVGINNTKKVIIDMLLHCFRETICYFRFW